MTIALALAASVWASVVDARERRIPNVACAVVAACGVLLQVGRLCAPDVVAALPLTPFVADALPAPLACLMWGAGGLVAGVCSEWWRRARTGRPGMGLGDVKLIAAWTLTLGWLMLGALVAACLLGALWAVVRGAQTFAMGPWLTLGCVAVLVVAAFL